MEVGRFLGWRGRLTYKEHVRNFREKNSSEAIVHLSVVGIVLQQPAPDRSEKELGEACVGPFHTGIRFRPDNGAPGGGGRGAWAICKVSQNL